jgi:H+/Cl- antiporter ClcA
MNVITLIRQRIKTRYDSINNEHFKRNFLNALPFWLGAFITGLFAVLYGKLFLLAESATILIYNQASWLFFIITPLTFLLGWWVVKKYAPYARGSGIPQVTASIELTNPKHYYKVDKLISIRIVFVKVFSSLIMVFGGAGIGREGPIIQIAASIFKKINDVLPAWYPKISKRNMIVTGAAAGLASAFNTPLGGIVFAIEELTKTHFSFFKSALITGVIIAGLTALTFFGPYLYLGYPQLDNVSAGIVLPVILVAMIAGFSGGGMGKIILYLLARKEILKNKYKNIIYVLVCGLVIALLAVFIDVRTFGSGKGIILTTLFTNDKFMPWYIPILRIIGPIISFSTGAAGGIFAPSLSAGASIGAVISGWMNLTGAETNLIVLCGMVAFLTGITRSPFTSSILVTEMTNSHNIIFYLMLTALVANIISNLISTDSFYDKLKDIYIHEIHNSGIPENETINKIA